MTTSVVLDFTAATTALNKAAEWLADHQGKPLAADTTDAVPRKEATRRAAETSRDLLYAAHECEVAKVEIMRQYHRFKGQPA